MADYVAGSRDAFVNLMNTYVSKLGLQNTHFQTVHGTDAVASTARRATWR